MKLYTTLCFLFLLAVLSGCEKDDSKIAYGNNTIFMPQAQLKSGGVDASYPVPSGVDSSTYNYQTDRTAGKLKVILGANISGPGAEGYSVSISVNTDTIQQILDAGVYPAATYLPMPASLYSLPEKLTVPAGTRGGTFTLDLDIEQLKLEQYVGKHLLLAVKISDPSNYELLTKLTTTIVVVDVDALVIGPSQDITLAYIKNPGSPFIASALNGKWGTLADWKANAAALSHSGIGGYVTDGDGKNMNLESGWGSPQIYNGKLYQTIELPAGTYSFDPSGGSWKWLGALDVAYTVVAPAVDTIPDFADILTATGFWYQQLKSPQTPVTFTLDQPGKVTVGIVVNHIQAGQGFKTSSVKLVTYPKHL
ncbi:MAG: DUF5013 domain-containing protein [Candidatus Pseudobacter hemicellulosilyticus]|uniref:DUF5013 domain-containing protein n=1 Tax=Candidatus Pseudobacter hemicellulosilyticus TaxID=3121375 RepID=A0AAJ6BG07_9BACT|nr:MAG: DUF5013 domain-containing protein [Pseudobacter sp.]